MKTFPRLLLTGVLAVAAGSTPLLAQQPTPRIPIATTELNVAGNTSSYQVHLDRLFFKSSGEIKAVPMQASLEKLLELAAELMITGQEEVMLVVRALGSETSNDQVLSNTVIVQLAPGGSAAEVQQRPDISTLEDLGIGDSYYVAEVSKPGTSPEVAKSLEEDPNVASSQIELMEGIQLHKGGAAETPRAPSGFDTLFEDAENYPIYRPRDTFFGRQWHLYNVGQVEGAEEGIDLDVVQVWNLYKGEGTKIAIVDSVVEISHPDLVGNNDSANNYNTDSPGSPLVLDGDPHGTAVAGLAAGVGNNNIGISGVAPSAQFSAVSLPASGLINGSTFARMMSHGSQVFDVSNNSWGFISSFFTNGSVQETTLMNLALQGRGGNGVVVCFSAGNGAESEIRSNYGSLANSRYTIAVGALGSDGSRAVYSEPGANVVCVAPTQGSSEQPASTTTDYTSGGYNPAFDPDTGERLPDLNNTSYTSTFNGTSASAPMVSGVIALLLQVNPDLTWREVQEILVQTCVETPGMSGGEWVTNGSGFRFSHDYGAGLISALEACKVAEVFPGMEPQIMSEHFTQTVPIAIPNNNEGGRNFSFEVETDIKRVEQVILDLDIDHTWRGDLVITLTSPSGTQSIFKTANIGDAADDIPNWPFLTVFCWGEDPNGTWTANVADVFDLDIGTIESTSLRLYGTQSDIDPVAEGLDMYPPRIEVTQVGFSGPDTSMNITPVGGEAIDDIGVRRVEYRADGSDWRVANRTRDGRWWFLMSGGTAEIRCIDRANKWSETVRVNAN